MKSHDVVAAFAFVTAKNAEKNYFFIFKLAAFTPEKLFFRCFYSFFFISKSPSVSFHHPFACVSALAFLSR